MTTRRDIQELQAARRVHLSWMMKAEILVSGIPVTEDKVPVSCHECCFSRWYKNASPAVRQHPDFAAIDLPHRELHDTFQKIWQLMSPQNCGSGDGRFTTNVTSAQKRQASELFETLKQQSQTLMRLLYRFEQTLAEPTQQRTMIR